MTQNGSSWVSQLVAFKADTGSSDNTLPQVSVTAPANGASVSGIVNVTADATDDVGVARVQFLVDGVDTGTPDSTAPYALAWDTRSVPNGAHTLRARAHRRGREHAAVRGGRRQRRERQLVPERDPAAGRPGPPDRDEVPAGRAPARVGAAGQDPGAPAAVHERRLEPVPADHEHRRRRRAAGDLRLRAGPQLQRQPLLLRLLHARVAQPRPGVALHRERAGHRHRCRAASSCSTRTRRTRTPSTTAAR